MPGVSDGRAPLMKRGLGAKFRLLFFNGVKEAGEKGLQGTEHNRRKRQEHKEVLK